MDKTNLKDVQDSLDTNCTIRTDERKRKYETTHPDKETVNYFVKILQALI